jgi:hypothetical protein
MPREARVRGTGHAITTVHDTGIAPAKNPATAVEDA